MEFELRVDTGEKALQLYLSGGARHERRQVGIRVWEPTGTHTRRVQAPEEIRPRSLFVKDAKIAALRLGYELAALTGSAPRGRPSPEAAARSRAQKELVRDLREQRYTPSAISKLLQLDKRRVSEIGSTRPDRG